MKKGINNLLYSKDLNTIDLLSPTFWQDIHLISPKELCTISMEDIQSGIQNQMDQLEKKFEGQIIAPLQNILEYPQTQVENLPLFDKEKWENNPEFKRSLVQYHLRSQIKDLQSTAGIDTGGFIISSDIHKSDYLDFYETYGLPHITQYMKEIATIEYFLLVVNDATNYFKKEKELELFGLTRSDIESYFKNYERMPNSAYVDFVHLLKEKRNGAPFLGSYDKVGVDIPNMKKYVEKHKKRLKDTKAHTARGTDKTLDFCIEGMLSLRYMKALDQKHGFGKYGNEIQSLIDDYAKVANMQTVVIKQTEWMGGLDNDNKTLQEVLDTLPGFDSGEISRFVRLVENPSSPIALPGAVNLFRHDCIHILLGRGLLAQDEAFVIGFTMGNAKKISSTQIKLFKTISSLLYPDAYTFSAEDLLVYQLGLELGMHGETSFVYDFPFEKHVDKSLGELRKLLQIDITQLKSIYKREQQIVPGTLCSNRLPIA